MGDGRAKGTFPGTKRLLISALIIAHPLLDDAPVVRENFADCNSELQLHFSIFHSFYLSTYLHVFRILCSIFYTYYFYTVFDESVSRNSVVDASPILIRF